MKKSFRILSLVLAIVMIASTASVVGYAAPYKGDGVQLTFNDVDEAVYSTEQYATMALDELDRMLNENAMVLDIYIGTLSIDSVDGTLESVGALLTSVSSLLDAGVLGDAALLKDPVNKLVVDGTKRTRQVDNPDTAVIYDLLDLIGGLAPVVEKYVQGNISLGILNSFISAYVFDVRELAFGILSGLTGLAKDENGEPKSWDYYFSDPTIPEKYQGTGTALIFAQDVLNTLVLGEWKQLDDLFYENGNKTSHIAYQEIQFHEDSVDGAIVTDELDIVNYDYYGWAHPDNWVTTGLGDFIRVPAGSAEPSPSYSKVTVTNLPQVYDFVEGLFLQAYNGILVPVLNRITKRWLCESLGYTFDSKYTEEFQYDINGEIKVDENGKSLINPDFDYLYMGEAPATISGDKIFQIFDVENLVVPYYEVAEAGYQSFILAFNHNLGLFIDGIIKATRVKNGSTTTYTVVDGGETYSFQWVDGNNRLLVDNVCSALKFLINFTGNEFFEEGLIERGEVKTPSEVNALGNQELLAYILRSVINANIPYIYIEEGPKTNSMAGVGLEACIQLAYQDIPQFTYTAPDPQSYSGDMPAYYKDCVEKGLAILMDIAAYNLNSVLDTEYAAATDRDYDTKNNGSENKTGLLGYLGDTGVYGTSVAAIAAWAVSYWASTIVPGEESLGPQCLLSGYDFASDNYNGEYANGKVTEADVWNDLGSLVNLIIPLRTEAGQTVAPDNRTWLHAEIADSVTNGEILKAIIFDYVVYPILNLDTTNLEKLLSVNPEGALSYDNIETILVDTVHRLFDVLFPDCFDASVTSIDTFLNNEKLAKMLSSVIVTLSATLETTSPNGNVITGKGKVLTGVALPIVCLILGLSSKQEFKELENYIPGTVSATGGEVEFSIYNGSSGVNTSYRDTNDSFKRKVDKLYTYTITTAVCNVIDGGSGTLAINGVAPGTTLTGGEMKTISISGLSQGQMLEITFKYTVSDEKGQLLNDGAELTKTNYCYVAESTQGDDEKLVVDKDSFPGYEVGYATDIYVGSGKGIKSIADYAFRIEDKGSSEVYATVSSIITDSQWLEKSENEAVTTQKLEGKGGTYVYMPFYVDSESYQRTEFDYEKDEDGAYILDDYGMRIKSGIKEPATGITYIPDGEYTVSIALTMGDITQTYPVRIHLYDDFGLSGLVSGAIAANRSTSTITSAGQSHWAPYYNALKNAASFVLKPNENGANFQTYIEATGNGTINESNKYLTLYRALYGATEEITKYEASSGAAGIWAAVNAKLPYNYTRKSYQAPDSDGNMVTVYYKDYTEYYEAGYGYVGMRNYVSHTYKTFKSAINDANSLIDREYKWIWATEEDYNAMTIAEKEAFKKDVDAYKAATEKTESISSVEAAYATHMIDLTYSRLIPIEGDNTKLAIALNRFGDKTAQEKSWSTGSWAAYDYAKTFAAATLADSSATAEQINWATTKLIESWKHLAEGADYTALTNVITAAYSFINTNAEGFGISSGTVSVEEAANQEIYTVASYTTYLEALKVATQLSADNSNNKGLSKGDQDVIDRAISNLLTAQENLVPFGQGGDEPGTEATFELKTSEDFDGPFSGNGAEYYPLINEDVFLANGLETYTVDDETYEISGVLYGVPSFVDEDKLIGMFNVENAVVEVISALGGYGTGSLVVIRDNAGEVLACYVVGYRGDLDSNGNCDSKDSSYLSGAINEKPDYLYLEPTSSNSIKIKLPGADINGDGLINSADKQILNGMVNESKPINQSTGQFDN